MGCYPASNEPWNGDAEVNSATSLGNLNTGTTIDYCYAHCKESGFLLFGMRYSGACVCSDTYGDEDKTDFCVNKPMKCQQVKVKNGETI